MSTIAKQTLRNSGYMLLALLVLALIPLSLFAQDLTIAATAEQLPWWQRVEEFQNIVLKWITAITAILTAFIALVAYLIAKVQELRGRLDRGVEREAEAKLAAKDTTQKVEVVNDKSHPVNTKETKP